MLNKGMERFLDFVQPYYTDKDSAHDFNHIKRILGRMEILTEGLDEPINNTLLSFLISFHGLGRKLGSDEDFKSEVIGLLKANGWTARQIEVGLTAVQRHTKEPKLMEEKLVYDANYLELVGAFGIAKAFTTGGALRQSFEETAEIYEHQYLDKVSLHTLKGKELFEEGKGYVKEFLERLGTELKSW